MLIINVIIILSYFKYIRKILFNYTSLDEKLISNQFPYQIIIPEFLFCIKVVSG